MSVRRFELVDGSSNKFWEVVVEGSAVVTRYGKIGAAGQTTTTDEGSPDKAHKLFEKLVREKTGKGYQEVKPKGVKAPKAVDAPKPVAAPPAPTEPWGTPELRQAAFRARRRAQRTTLRRQNAPTWFSPEQLAQLAADPALAESMMPAAPAKPARGGGDDDDDGDDEEYDDEEEEDFDDDE